MYSARHGCNDLLGDCDRLRLVVAGVFVPVFVGLRADSGLGSVHNEDRDRYLLVPGAVARTVAGVLMTRVVVIVLVLSVCGFDTYRSWELS
jgi:hypothetical protein